MSSVMYSTDVGYPTSSTVVSNRMLLCMDGSAHTSPHPLIACKPTATHSSKVVMLFRRGCYWIAT